ncbi:hypothetical protein ABFV80_000925 [Vandammella animalimorsus]|uniref:hypothetical protein n=1 Tax=Vandammella animalimorsus TaxID=2029117 RepID=UPI00325A8997
MDDAFLMLTPAGALHSHALRQPDEACAALQSLMHGEQTPRRSAWLAQSPEHRAVLARALYEGWVDELPRSLPAPTLNLDHYLPHAIAGLSSTRTAALASDQGFCLARVGYDERQAETLCAVAADFSDFMQRQQQRGWSNSGRAISFYQGIDMLMPDTSLALFWVDGVGYWLILGGEPLLNNRALVELIWGIHAAGSKFARSSLARQRWQSR